MNIRFKEKKLGIWLLALFLFATHILVRSAAAAEPAPTPWKQVTAKSKDCQISFPSEPQMIQQALKVSDQGHTLTYDIYLAPLNRDTLCLLLIANYPVAMHTGNELAGLEGLLNGILSHNPDSKMVFANVINHRGHPTVDFLIESSTSYFRGQALMVGNKLFLMAVEGKPNMLDEKSFKRFSGSFALIP